MYLKSSTFTEAMRELSVIAEAEMAVLNKKVEENIPKVREVGKWPSVGEFNWNTGNGWINSRTASLNSYESEWFKFYGSYSEKTIEELTQGMLDKRYAEILERIAQLEAAVTKAWQDNVEAINNNKLVREKVELMMKHCGIASTYTTYEFPTSRSRTKKAVTHSAGYLGDLTRNVPISVQGSKPNAEEYKKKAERLYKDMSSKIADFERQKRIKETKAKEVHELALLRAKYCPDNALADLQDILGGLLEKDKYLRLAYWLERNRGDWTEGYNYAEIGIDSFSVQTEVDKEIEEDIRHYIDNWDGDGRVFRDCEYNYSVLYGMADAALYADLSKLRSMDDE